MKKMLLLVGVLFVCACGSSSSGGVVPSWGGNLLVFSDVHFNPFYDASIFDELVDTSADGWAAIFATSGITDPSAFGHDANYPLLVKALASIKTAGAGFPIVIFTGDILRHDFASSFYRLYGRTDATAMKAFADKTVLFFAEQVRANLGSTPVMFVLGNNDCYEDYDIEPDGDFLTNTADTFYDYFVTGTVDESTFLATYRSGGYYVAEPFAGLQVIGVNSVFFSSDAPAGLETAVQDELDWLETTLASARADGNKVWLLMHIPPGGNLYSIKNHLDAEGHIADPSLVNMMWYADYQASLLEIVNAYSDIITLSLAGHTHMDEYRLPSFGMEVTPAISPLFGNDPAYKIFTYNTSTFEPTDYRTVNYNLPSVPAAFDSYYTFDASYLQSGAMNTTLATLLPLLKTDSTDQSLYRGYYYAGHDSSNPITDLNWPVYWCGVGEMVKQDLIDCVNGY